MPYGFPHMQAGDAGAGRYPCVTALPPSRPVENAADATQKKSDIPADAFAITELKEDGGNVIVKVENNGTAVTVYVNGESKSIILNAGTP